MATRSTKRTLACPSVASLIPVIATLFLVVGCNRAEIAEERSRLDLARATNDIDQMFLSTSKLIQFGETSLQAELDRLKSGVAARERMRTALGDHDHEAALHEADALLKIFPGNKEGVRTVRESGQIFFLLTRAQRALSEVKDGEATPTGLTEDLPANLTGNDLKEWQLGQVRKSLAILGRKLSDPEHEFGKDTKKALKEFLADYKGTELTPTLVTQIQSQASLRLMEVAKRAETERRCTSIAQARQLVRKARELDPQFKNSTALEELLDKAHASLVYKQIEEINLWGEWAFLQAADLHDTLIKGLQTSINSRYDSPQEYWTRVSDIVESSRNRIKSAHVATLETAIRVLSTYDSGVALELAQNGKSFALFIINSIDRLMDPTGNFADFRQAGVDTIDTLRASKQKLENATPSPTTASEFESAAGTVADFPIYKDPRNGEIVEKNVQMFEL